MRIGVAGCGFVGNAVVDGINKLDPGHEFYKYDPYLYKDIKIESLKDCEMTFEEWQAMIDDYEGYNGVGTWK